MKKVLLAIIISTIFISLSFMSCSNEPPKSELEKKSENMAETAQDSIHGLQKDIDEARTNLREDINNTISNINQKIEETDIKINKAAKNQKAAWEEEKKDLIAARVRLNESLKEAGNDAKTTWDSFAINVKRTLHEVNYKLNQ